MPDLDRPGNVLHCLSAAIGEFNAEFSEHLGVHLLRDTDATGFSDLLQSSGYIHAVAVDIVAIYDYITKVHAYPVFNPLVIAPVCVVFSDLCLHRNSPIDGIHDARKLGQQSVPHELHDPSAVLGDLRRDQFRKTGLEASVGASLVRAHETRIADHIGGYDCYQSALSELGHIESLAAATMIGNRAADCGSSNAAASPAVTYTLVGWNVVFC